MASAESAIAEQDLPSSHGKAWEELSEAPCTNGGRPHIGCDRIDAILPTAGLHGQQHQSAVQAIACKTGARACAGCLLKAWSAAPNGHEVEAE